MDEHGERKRKSFSGTTKAEVNKKMTDYIADFENQAVESDESKKALQDSMQNWLQVFKFPSVEQTTYDRCECSAQNQIILCWVTSRLEISQRQISKSAQLLDEQSLRLHHR